MTLYFSSPFKGLLNANNKTKPIIKYYMWNGPVKIDFPTSIFMFPCLHYAATVFLYCWNLAPPKLAF